MSGTKWENVCGCCIGPIGHDVPSPILLAMHRCHRGSNVTSTKDECTHSSTTSMQLVGAASQAPLLSGAHRPQSSFRAKPPSSKSSAGQMVRPAGSRVRALGSTPRLQAMRCTPAAAPAPGAPASRGMPRMSRMAASAVPQILYCSSSSRAATRIACAASAAAAAAKEPAATAVCTPLTSEAPVPARLVTQVGGGPTPSALHSASQKWQQFRESRS
mmetsp:Transcript_60155/g.193662  ORF Transcript_60155/g.193662 Transcript_60155/m.193662 type:complete len:216 (+) Transcript_60155:518-1165(+)